MLAGGVLLVLAVSGRLRGTPITPAILFVAIAAGADGLVARPAADR